jgi:hypothetical protein
MFRLHPHLSSGSCLHYSLTLPGETALCHGSDQGGYRGRVRNQRRELPILLPPSPPPPTDELSVGSKGLLGCRLSISLVKLQDLHPLLRNFAFAKASEAPEHTL